MILHSLTRRCCNYANPKSLGSRIRRRRMHYLLPLLSQIHAEKGRVRIVDLGGTLEYWQILPEELWEGLNLDITIVNIYDIRMEGRMPAAHAERVHPVVADCCQLPTEWEGAFDLAHSNSVIEHVGQKERRLAFVQEAFRVAERIYLQTPDYLCPLEPHFMCPFFHWLPLSLRTLFVRAANMGQFRRAETWRQAREKADSVRLLSKGELKRLIPLAAVYREWLFGLPKSLILIA
jgi:hypothetical protein